MGTMHPGDELTLSQLLRFNPLWNDSDRAVLAEDIETFGGAKFVYGERGYNRHVLVLDGYGRELMAVSPGTFYYVGGRSRPGSVLSESHPGHVFRTSRYRHGGAAKSKSGPDYGSLCTSCFLHHPLGECDQ